MGARQNMAFPFSALLRPLLRIGAWSASAVLAIAVAAFVLLSVFAGRADDQQSALAKLISQLLSSKGSQVTIGAVEGALSSNATIRDVSIADKDGVWLKVDRVTLIWSRLALLRRRLEVDNLDIGKLEILRKPVADPSAPASPPASNEPLLPELPVKVIVKAFKLDELALGADVAGVAARLRANGAMMLGAPSEGLDANLTIDRLDGDGAAQIKLLFVPKGETLKLDVTHREASNGLLSRLAGIPGHPPVAFTVKGEGPLDKWSADLDFSAGQTIGARGRAELLRRGAGRRLQLDLTSRIEGLLGPLIAPVFAGETTLKGDADLRDDGSVDLRDLQLASRLARMTIVGGLAADKTFDVKLTARALANDDGQTRHRQVSIGKLQLDARARGSFEKPFAEGKFEARRLSMPAGGFDSVIADFSLRPADNKKIDVAANASVAGLRLAKRSVAKAAGGSINALFRAQIAPGGAVEIVQSRIVSPVYDARFAGRIAKGRISGDVEATVLRLEALSELAGHNLRGRAQLFADIAGEPGKSIWDIGVRGQTADLSFGDPRLDRIAGPIVTLQGRFQHSPAQIGVQQLFVAGRGFEANAAGRLGGIGGGVRFALAVADAAGIDERLRGRISLSGTISGNRNNPDASIELRAPQLSAIGKPIRDLLLTIEGKRLFADLQASVRATGNIDRRALRGRAEVAKLADGALRVEDIAFSLGSANLKGNAALAPTGLVAGVVAVDAPDLSHLSALFLHDMRGSAKADIRLNSDGGRQHADVKADMRSLVFGEARIASATADITARDLLARPSIAGVVRASGVRAAGETIGRLVAEARSAGKQTAFTVSANGGTLSLTAAGTLDSGAAMRIQLRSLSAVRRGLRVALAGPATIALVDGGVATQSLTLASSGGRINLSGRAGRRLALKVDVSNMPLSAARALAPQLSLAGRLRARADLRGAPASPQGTYSVDIDGFASPETRAAGVPPLAIDLSGQLLGRRATVKGTVRGGRQIALRLNGAAPFERSGALSVAIDGVIDAGLANASLAAGGQRLTGKLTVNASVRGTMARPAVSGSASLSGGTFRDPLQGVSFTDVSGRFSGRGDRINVDRLTARTVNGGVVTVQGTVSTNAAAGFPADLRIGAQKAQLVSNDIMTLVAGLNLRVSGPVATAPVISGGVDIRSLNVNIPERLPASAAPLANAKHIAPPPQTVARLKAIARARAQRQRRKRAGVRGPRLDVRINAPNQVFVRGRGVDAELGGSVRVAGYVNEPRANGAFELRRGRIDLLTQRIDFTRGRLTFLGDIIPELDFIASSSAGAVTARVLITGKADNPNFAFTSEPALAPDEVLSHLLFQKAAGSLTPFQAVQLAAAVATLTGKGGSGFLDKTRQALGVDTLDVNVGGKNGPSVGASRYISRRISVGGRAGTTPANSAATVKIDVTRRIKLFGEVGGDGRTSVGIGTEIEY